MLRVDTNQLNTLGCEVTSQKFLDRLKFSNSVKQAWIENRDVHLSPGLVPMQPSVITSTPELNDVQPDMIFDQSLSEIPSDEISWVGLEDIENSAEESRDGEGSEKDVEETLTHSSNFIPTVMNDVDSLQCTDAMSTTENDCRYRNLNLTNIAVPCAVKRRGRPKGFDKTVIGLSKKCKKSSATRKIPFKKLGCKEKAILILRWLIDEERALSAVHDGKIIEEKFVESVPDKVSDSITDDVVNIDFIKKYFSQDTWAVVKQVLQ
ncbi:uncharacterized protein [Venturia canescens]|uniref:uncharacterized protein n=1 Tax=Venturia canescens TaxID=32260 RepID=UPI001C9C5C5D|nr:uncharacterized protein LOC122408126 [Venturia canescens]